MNSFKFSIELQLGRKLYAHTGNLSTGKDACNGKSLADLIVQTLEGIRDDREYSLFYQSVE